MTKKWPSVQVTHSAICVFAVPNATGALRGVSPSVPAWRWRGFRAPFARISSAHARFSDESSCQNECRRKPATICSGVNVVSGMNVVAFAAATSNAVEASMTVSSSCSTTS